VQLFGWVDDVTRSRLYAECDLFVAPSRYESFGLGYLESMAFGKPCFGCDAGGARKIVVPGKTGLLVPPGDAGALAGAILDLARDRPRRLQLGAAAREHVIANFSADRMVDRTIDLYEELLGARVRVAQEPPAVFSR
jgi:glycosyltransferase involved in cell wall biosynthesis